VFFIPAATHKTEYGSELLPCWKCRLSDLIFFLEHAGELRINILRRIKGKRAPKSYRKRACNYASQLLQEKESG